MTGAEPIRFEILGPVRAYVGERELDLGPLKQRALLAALLLNANQAVSTQQLVDTVWPDAPPHNGANVVQKYVGGLRRVLEPDRAVRAPAQWLVRTDGGYLLRVQPGYLDAEVFARPLTADAGTDRLREILARWHGEPLAGLPGTAFEHARGRLAESRAATAETLAELEIAAGRHRQLIPELVRLVDDFPLREQPRYLLMLALHRSGRQAEALEVFSDGQRFLSEEFGIDPGDRLKDLQLRILRADPRLDPDREVAVAEPADEFRALATASALDRPRDRVPAGYRAESVLPAWTPRPARLAVTAVAPQVSHPGWRWVGKLLAGLVPLVTIGLGACIVIAVVAIWRRSWRLGLVAAGYLLYAVGAVIVIDVGAPADPDKISGPQVALALVLVFVLNVWCAIQGLLLVRAPVRRPGGVGSWTVRIGGALLSLLSFGVVTWAVFAYYAIRRRSIWLGLATVGYLVAPIWLLVVASMDTATDPNAPGSVTGMVVVVVIWVLSFVGAAHALAIDPDRHQGTYLPTATAPDLVASQLPVFAWLSAPGYDEIPRT
jgi:DNA-binding SARP family transcriptional activator